MAALQAASASRCCNVDCCNVDCCNVDCCNVACERELMSMSNPPIDFDVLERSIYAQGAEEAMLGQIFERIGTELSLIHI